MKSTFLLAAVCLSLACTRESNLITEQVRTTSGPIAGTHLTEPDLHVFLGIPYAAPPVGELRWKAPQAPESWTEVLECKAFGPSPVQGKPVPFMYWTEEFLIPAEPIGEDCLSLNVWTPAKTREDKLPVLVYIYGGGFRSGGSGCAIYDGAATAEKDIVFVSINYRVGIFGFLAHPELSEETAHGGSGNYALLDMIAALEWVRDNIGSFGGDAGNVTIAGQSAGAFAVNYLTASPLANGLFHKAIAQSGANFVSSSLRPALTMEQAEQLGVAYMEALGATDLAAMRALPAETLLNTPGGLSGPLVDGHVLPASVQEMYRTGKQNDVPVLIGYNKDDLVGAGNMDAEAYKGMLGERFGALAGDFLNAYPAGSDEEARRSQAEMGRDETFGIQVYAWAKTQDHYGTQPVYLYRFNRDLPAGRPEDANGAFHSGEIVYAYDNLHTLNRPWEDADREIASVMSGYWANFVRTGNPNGEGLPQWTVYDPDQEMTLVLDHPSAETRFPDAQKMACWEAYFQSH
ncbi:MAG: carboxylesterase family protein [Bacteroidales bacterium]